MPGEILHFGDLSSCDSYSWHLFMEMENSLASHCDKNRLAFSLTFISSTNDHKRIFFLYLIHVELYLAKLESSWFWRSIFLTSRIKIIQLFRSFYFWLNYNLSKIFLCLPHCLFVSWTPCLVLYLWARNDSPLSSFLKLLWEILSTLHFNHSSNHSLRLYVDHLPSRFCLRYWEQNGNAPLGT